MTSTEVAVSEKLFSKKLQAYLAENPCSYDVTFSVGPTKERVGAVKLILVAASPVFRKLFEENWDMAVLRNNEGISLPDIDAAAFKIFLQLLPSEHISIEALQKLELTADQILNLVSISKQFGMPTMQAVFEEMSQPFFKYFDTYASTLDFLKLSPKNLATILASDQVLLKEIDVFKFVCWWAQFQVCKSGTASEREQTNLRDVLGESLKEIRFPVMTFQEFGRVVCPQEILTADEKLKIFEYISLADDERDVFDKASLGFKTTPRIIAPNPPISDVPMESSSNQQSILELFGNEQFVSSPSTACGDSSFSYLYFDLDKKIELLGIGFSGPAHSDGEYDVRVRLNVFMNGTPFSCGSTQQIIQAKHCEKFHIIFDYPVICNPGQNPKLFTYYIDFSLKGPDMQSVDTSKRKDKTGKVSLKKVKDGVTFIVKILSSQIVELIFRKLE